MDALSDAIKEAELVRGCPEPVKTHLQMNLQTYVSYTSIRNAVQCYTEAKRTWRSEAAQANSSTDMEVDAGHPRQAWTRSERLLVQRHRRRKKGKGKLKGKGKQKGKGKDKDKPVTEVSLEDSQSSNNSQIVASFTSDWIFAVTTASLEEIYESEAEILLDSGACDHVCSPEFANHSLLLPRLETGVVHSADGSEIPTHGSKTSPFRTGGRTE